MKVHLDTTGTARLFTERYRLSTEESPKLNMGGSWRWMFRVGTHFLHRENGQKIKTEKAKGYIKITNKNLSGKSGIRGLIDTLVPSKPGVFKKTSPVN